MLRRLTRSRLPALAVALALLAPAGARAGNDDGVLLGNEAAMSAGAVTAIVNDGSATWYNPAGIAAVDRDTLDLSGSATMLRIADTPALLQSAATGAAANGGYYEFLGIPSAVTLVRRLDRTTAFSLGIFVPQLTGHTDRVSLAEVVDRPAPDPDYASRWQLTQQESSSTYYGGLTLGIALLPNVRVGFTLFGTYRSAAFSTQFAGGVTVDDAPFEAIGLMSMETLQSVSLEIGAGLQWDIMPGLTLGLARPHPRADGRLALPPHHHDDRLGPGRARVRADRRGHAAPPARGGDAGTGAARHRVSLGGGVGRHRGRLPARAALARGRHRPRMGRRRARRGPLLGGPPRSRSARASSPTSTRPGPSPATATPSSTSSEGRSGSRCATRIGSARARTRRTSCS